MGKQISYMALILGVLDHAFCAPQLMSSVFHTGGGGEGGRGGKGGICPQAICFPPPRDEATYMQQYSIIIITCNITCNYHEKKKSWNKRYQ